MGSRSRFARYIPKLGLAAHHPTAHRLLVSFARSLSCLQATLEILQLPTPRNVPHFASTLFSLCFLIAFLALLAADRDIFTRFRHRLATQAPDSVLWDPNKPVSDYRTRLIVKPFANSTVRIVTCSSLHPRFTVPRLIYTPTRSRMSTAYGMPYLLEDTTGNITDSSFADIFQRMSFNIRCTMRNSDRSAYMIYDVSAASTRAGRGGLMVPVACLGFGANGALGTVKIRQGETIEMDAYLSKVSRKCVFPTGIDLSCSD